MKIYQHFRPEEQHLIDQILDWKDQVERTHVSVLTDFLDPREQIVFQSVIGQDEEFRLSFDGGYDEAERKRAILAPFYVETSQKDFQMTALRGTYPAKFVTLSHRDVLGSMMSLGIHRKKLGDLTIAEGEFQIICDESLAPYFQMNLTQIKKSRVSLEEVKLEHVVAPSQNWEVKESTVSSVRLDVVMKEIYRMSRQQAQKMIEKEAVKVNHQVIQQPAYQLEAGDLLSVRTKGRSKMLEVLGTTKKDKQRIKTALLK
ncbi:RNA-binding protein [Allobacillus sp. GCM10007491]|uniref:RNA-binding protein n=1 Tax=Allobacillus saliphilus TaxID=2912308 RepID=A0A941CUI7_9BACI|nr:RNA-binding protein [Allobacillus saliphilus]MBR7552811.1 RNA-binding protein [Allobacillus saliphilus]